MSVEMLIYCPPMEESKECITGWEKETIAFVSANKSKVYNRIRGIAKSLSGRNLQTTDVEDIYSELLVYLYGCDDYNLEKAIERSNSNSIVTLEGYVNICIKYCALRHCTEQHNVEKETVSEHISSDGNKEMSLFDAVSDQSSLSEMDTVLYDINELCNSSEALRYRYGPDLFLVLYVRLLTMGCKKDLYLDMLSILGVSRKDLTKLEKRAAEEELMLSIVRAIGIAGVQKSLDAIRPYVFCAEKIEETINKYR